MKFNKDLFKIALFFQFLAASPIWAETAEGGTNLESVFKVMVALTAFLIAILMWLLLVYSEKNDTTGESFLTPVKTMMRWITKSTPVSQEHEILLSHDYDGIRELDNKVPPWFNFLFYGTILFAIIYMVNFHVIGSGNIQEEEYLEEVRMANLQKEILTRSGSLLDETNVSFANDPGTISNGKQIFTKNCAACHGQNGEGLVGPNLTDNYWIHGGGIKNIFKVIKYGVPQKGMISWQSQLNPTQIKEVGSFIISLKGTNPPNGKPAEGELYTPETTEAQKADKKS